MMFMEKIDKEAVTKILWFQNGIPYEATVTILIIYLLLLATFLHLIFL